MEPAGSALAEPTQLTELTAAMDRLGRGAAARALGLVERATRAGTFVWEVATGRVELSPRSRDLLGVDATFAAATEPLLALVEESDHDRLRQVRDRWSSLDEPSIEIHVERPNDGARRRLRVEWDVIRDDGGVPVGVVGSLLDETERMTVATLDESLRESQALWLSIGMNPADFVSLVDRDGVYQWVNHTAPGIRVEDLIGKSTLFEMIAVENHGDVRAALDRCFDEGLPAYFEAYSPPLRAWFASSLGAVVRGGRTTLASILTRDITAAKSAMGELARRERMLAEAQRIAGVGSWHWTASTRALEWSEELFRIFGVGPSVTPTVDLFHALVHPEDRPTVLAAWERARVQGIGDKRQYRIRRQSDGATRYVSTVAEPISSASGALAGYLGTTLDVTERRELEADLAQSRKLEAVGRLAGGIAHDFNNVLTAILGNAEVAAKETPPSSPAAANLAVIRQAGERASSLIRQLLAFARRQIVAPEVMAPNALIDSVAALLRPLLGRHVRLDLVLPRDVWLIRVDVGQFEQLLMNLAVNALDAMPRGGTLRIETRNVTIAEKAAPHPRMAPGEYVALIVVDSGEGIPEDVQPRVFEPFFTTKPNGRGTGLGLATCHGIVTQSGGHIWLESALGVGTTVFSYLPRSRGEPADASAAPAARKSVGEGEGETILVVEDEPMVRKLVVRSLKSLGYRILEAPTGKAAVSTGARYTQPIHLLFSDLVLPDGRGSDVATALATSHPEAKVLYTSGYTDDDAVAAGVLAARVKLLQKPYTLAALSLAVRTTLDGDGG